MKTESREQIKQKGGLTKLEDQCILQSQIPESDEVYVLQWIALTYCHMVFEMG